MSINLQKPQPTPNTIFWHWNRFNVLKSYSFISYFKEWQTYGPFDKRKPHPASLQAHVHTNRLIFNSLCFHLSSTTQADTFKDNVNTWAHSHWEGVIQRCVVSCLYPCNCGKNFTDMGIMVYIAQRHLIKEKLCISFDYPHNVKHSVTCNAQSGFFLFRMQFWEQGYNKLNKKKQLDLCWGCHWFGLCGSMGMWGDDRWPEGEGGY